jgi:hypothetical protein
VQIIVEEGHSLPHLIHIWHFLVRHADLFYSSRAQFVPQVPAPELRAINAVDPHDRNPGGILKSSRENPPRLSDFS